jgi:hypothetical protein
MLSVTHVTATADQLVFLPITDINQNACEIIALQRNLCNFLVITLQFNTNFVERSFCNEFRAL